MAELNINKACIDALPNYNGDPATLGIFLSASEHFLLTFHNENNQQNNEWLLRIIINKLQGRALTLIGSREEATSWNAIKQLLITYFGDQRNIKCLVRDLMNIKIERNETPYMLGMRIQDIRSLILTKLKMEDPNHETRLIKQQMYDGISLDAYINALPERLSDKIRFRNPASLEQAMNLVVEEENVNYYRERSNNLGTNQNYKPTPRLQPSVGQFPRANFNNFMPKFQPKPQTFNTFNRPQINQSTRFNHANSNRFNNNQWPNRQNYNINRGFNTNNNMQNCYQPFRNQSQRIQQRTVPHNFSEPMDTSSGNTRNSGIQRRTNFLKSNNQKPNFTSQELFYHETPQEVQPQSYYFEENHPQNLCYKNKSNDYFQQQENAQQNENFHKVPDDQNAT